MTVSPEKKTRKNAHFWRACRYLWPYRPMVAVSVVAALFVGLAMTGGLGGMLPILNVLANGDSVQGWLYRAVAQQRLGVKFYADPNVLRIVIVNKDGPFAAAGLSDDARIEAVSLPANAPPSPFAGQAPSSDNDENQRRSYTEILRRIACADQDAIELTVNDRPVTVRPALLRWYFSLALDAGDHLPIRPVQAVAAVFALMALLSITGQVANYFQEHYADKAAIFAANDIRQRLYDRVLRIPVSHYAQQGASDVTSRVISDATALQDGYKTVLGQSIQEPIKAMMALAFAVCLSWQLTLFIVAFAPIMAVIVRKFGKKMRRASRKALQTSSAVLGQIEGTLAGIRVVKNANAERFERRRFSRVMAGLIDEQVRMSRIDAISSPVLESFIMLMAGCVVIFATYMVRVSGSLSATNFVMAMITLAMIGESLRKASKVNNALQKANAAAGRIFQTLDAPVERPRVTTREHPPRKLPPLHQNIRFENVTFRYPGAAVPAVDGVSLVVPSGQAVAIVGRNGSGKTTLAALLPRFFDPEAGRITFDGSDIRDVTLASLRRQIGIVTQDSVIFPGTIAQNIAYGNSLAAADARPSPQRDALRQQIEEAARQAFAHDFVTARPAGYDTPLEGSGQLSGGERQRLCIARAILRAAPVLILDEATSQVDAESEHLIQLAIDRLMHQRTTFVIAHRFSTIKSADVIVVMDRGRIVGQGSHDQLMQSCLQYQQLYQRQIEVD